MDFNEIIANIEKELAELKRINETLIKENTLLKTRMNISNISTESNSSSLLSIEHVFYNVIYVGRKGQARNYAYRALMEYGCVLLKDINEKNLAEMYKSKKIGIASLAFIVAILKHYSIDIEIPFYVLNIKRLEFEQYLRRTENAVTFFE